MKKNRQFAVVIIVISICVAVFLISFFCYTLKEKGRKEEPDIDLEYADSIEYLLLSRDDVHFIYGENYLSGTLVSYEYLNGIVELGELYRINKNTLCNCVTDGEFYEFVFWGIHSPFFRLQIGKNTSIFCGFK